MFHFARRPWARGRIVGPPSALEMKSAISSEIFRALGTLPFCRYRRVASSVFLRICRSRTPTSGLDHEVEVEPPAEDLGPGPQVDGPQALAVVPTEVDAAVEPGSVLHAAADQRGADARDAERDRSQGEPLGPGGSR